MNKSEKTKNRISARLKGIFKGNPVWFFLFSVMALLIPDLVLKTKVIFVDFRVDESAWLRAWLCNIVPVIFTVLWIGFFLFLCIWADFLC